MKGTLVQELAKLESRMEGIIEEEGSDDKTIAKKMAKKGRRVLRKDGTSLFQLEEELGMGFVELAILRCFEKVRINVYKTVPPSWKLEDFQKECSQEGMKGTME